MDASEVCVRACVLCVIDVWLWTVMWCYRRQIDSSTSLILRERSILSAILPSKDSRLWDRLSTQQAGACSSDYFVIVLCSLSVSVQCCWHRTYIKHLCIQYWHRLALLLHIEYCIHSYRYQPYTHAHHTTHITSYNTYNGNRIKQGTSPIRATTKSSLSPSPSRWTRPPILLL